MAIARMKKLTLVGMLHDKEGIFDAIIKTKSVELIDTADFSDASRRDCDSIKAQLSRIEGAIATVRQETDKYNSINKGEDFAIPKKGIAAPFFEISFKDFIALSEGVSMVFNKVEQIEKHKAAIAECNVELARAADERDRLAIYAKLARPASCYKSTQSTTIALGVAPQLAMQRIIEDVSFAEAACVEVINQENGMSLAVIAAHKSVAAELFGKIYAHGFVNADIDDSILPSQRIKELNGSIDRLKQDLNKHLLSIAEHCSNVPEFELYYDYLELQLKKAEAELGIQKTESSFVLNGYYPAEREEEIKTAIAEATEFYLLYFNELSDTDDAPILYDNKDFFRTFEPVTNMYTPPSYKEIDPNPVMSVFYLLIFGLMVADMGYGLVLCLAGLGAARLIKQETGIKRLAKLFGVCGFGAIIVGALYGTFFSMTLYSGVIPDPSVYPKTTMVICILFGVVHLSAGFVTAAVKEARRKNLAQVIVAIMWVLFFAGAFMFLLNPALGFMDYPPFASVALPKAIEIIGIVFAAIGLVGAMIFSGAGKGIGGRLISAFTSVYGILNYFGDVMSYIRIFGLMLSSAMMGVVINMLAQMVMSSGVVGIVLGVVLLVFAHLFNLAIGVLGVYIHCGRLQYVEFFGKFYEGDGRLFAPFGGDMKYTLVNIR